MESSKGRLLRFLSPRGSVQSFYDNNDPRELPLYSVGEASRYLHIPHATLRSWVAGRTYSTREGETFFKPLLRLPDMDAGRLSFGNLVEAHVLRALRTKHGVPIRKVRSALSYAEEQLQIQRLLLSEELQTEAGDLLIERYGELLNLSKSGQLALKKLLEVHLKRVERDSHHFPSRLYPFLTADLTNGSGWVVIDPRIEFGRPTIVGKGITTAVLAARIDAGETVQVLAEDYDLEPSQIEEAIVYEKAA